MPFAKARILLTFIKRGVKKYAFRSIHRENFRALKDKSVYAN